MNNIGQQLDVIEEVLSELVKKISSSEKYSQNQKDHLDDRMRNLITEVNGYLKEQPPTEVLMSQISNLHNSIKTFPQQSRIKHHHHFDLQSRGFIISAAILLVVSAISVGTAVTNSRENNRLRSSDVRFRMIRQVNPEIVTWTDSIYYKNPELAEKETEIREARELALKDAEALLKQKQQETKKAQNFLKKLKKD
jgi:hypothetical protein